MNELFFQTPWWLPTGLILLGLAVFWTCNQRRQRGGMYAGLGIVVAGIAVGVISYFVDTDQEKSVRRVEGIVAAVNTRDWKTFHDLLSVQTNVYSVRGPDQITSLVERAADRFNLGVSRITGSTIKQSDSLIEVDIRLFSQAALSNGVSDWQFSFQDFGRGFELRQIQALPNAEQDSRQISDAVNALR